MDELKNDLKRCKITFDERVLITDLINEYKSSLEEINKVLEDYVQQEETKGNKFEKNFIVHGKSKTSQAEVYGVVGSEANTKEWMDRLEDAESFLYSLQIAGGAKKKVAKLRPVKHVSISLENTEQRPALSYCTNNEAAPQAEVKTFVKKSNLANAFAKQSETKPAVETPVPKKTSPETKKTTPEEKKPVPKVASASKKGINSFFAPASAANKKPAANKPENSKSNGVIKPPTPKKIEDFLTKSSETPTPLKNIKSEIKKESSPAVNTSVQLFNEEEDEEESSDEEDKLEALKRDIITSEIETEDQADESSHITSKRRRIIDSDEEDEEPQKKLKDDEEEEQQKDEESAPQSETFLDEDGFAVTIKKKGPNLTKSKPSKKTPPSASKSLSKSPMKSSGAKASSSSEAASKGKAAAASSKTKQGNIMSFFSKK